MMRIINPGKCGRQGMAHKAKTGNPLRGHPACCSMGGGG